MDFHSRFPCLSSHLLAFTSQINAAEVCSTQDSYSKMKRKTLI